MSLLTKFKSINKTGFLLLNKIQTKVKMSSMTNPIIYDCRSDTVTVPSDAMRKGVFIILCTSYFLVMSSLDPILHILSDFHFVIYIATI